ncbi:MAG: PatB family C-S lyase [Acidimicrobiales bacterium]|nr:PatB family C-S lyase [Acidimicrobiales bacterium]
MIEIAPLEALQKRPGVKWQKFGPDVLGMWVADMDFAVAEPIMAALRSVLDTGDLGYTVPALSQSIRDGFADRMAGRYGWNIDPADVVLTQDVIQGIQLVLQNCLEPGAGVAIQTPIYPPFLSSLETTNCRLVDNRWIRNGQDWVLDVDALEDSCRRGEVQAILLCNPHNPIGRAFRRAELEELARLANQYDLLILSDEIHAELVHPGNEHIPIASLNDDVASRTVTYSSASKPFNLAALRLAQMHTTSPRIRAAIDSMPDHSLGGMNVFGMVGTAAAWNHGDNWLESAMGQLTANRDLLSDLLAQHIPDIDYVKPEATYLAWLDCTALGLGDEVSKFFIDHAGVACNRGLDFGQHGAGCMRMNLATSPEVISLAVQRMAEALDRHNQDAR